MSTVMEAICFNSSQRVERTANVLLASPEDEGVVENYRSKSRTHSSGHRARIIADEDDLVAFELSQTRGKLLIDLVAIAQLNKLSHAFLGGDDTERVRHGIHRSAGSGHRCRLETKLPWTKSKGREIRVREARSRMNCPTDKKSNYLYVQLRPCKMGSDERNNEGASERLPDKFYSSHYHQPYAIFY